VLFQKIPEFSLVSQTDEEASARSFCGHYLILYFYPKANTPGCTREAHDFTALLPQFRKLDARIVGVSPDKPEAQARFVAAKWLSVTMLSDPDKTLAREFGALKENGGILRSTFLIDRTGVVRAEWKKVKVDGHAQEVLEKLTSLSAAQHRVHPLIASRRAYRALLKDPVPREDIETLLAAAHLAPSCFNNQPWRFVAIDDAAVLTKIKGAMPKGNYWTGPAPAIIAVFSAPHSDCQLSDRRDYERGHLNAPSRESGDEKCLLPKAAQFVVQWRHGYKERESLCVRHEVPLGMGAEVSEVDTAGRDQRSGERVVQRDSTIPRV